MRTWLDLINAGYILFKPNDWQLSKDAPKEAKKLYEVLIKRDEENAKKGIVVD